MKAVYVILLGSQGFGLNVFAPKRKRKANNRHNTVAPLEEQYFCMSHSDLVSHSLWSLHLLVRTHQRVPHVLNVFKQALFT